MLQASSTTRLILGIAFSMLLCFCFQALFVYGLDWKTGKGESNYFSTLSRFQAAAEGPAKIAFAGSSITGRLPGREIGNVDIANLGSDGGPALDGLKLLSTGRVALPQWVVIETNTLYGGIGFQESLVLRNTQGQWFMVGSRITLLSASARPSAMLYQKLLRRPKVLTSDSFSIRATKLSLNDKIVFTKAEQERYEEYEKSVNMLLEKGVKVILMQFPAGRMRDKEKKLVDYTVSKLTETGKASYVNMEVQIPREKLAFTDGVHLNPESAAKVLSSVASYIRKVESGR